MERESTYKYFEACSTHTDQLYMMMNLLVLLYFILPLFGLSYSEESPVVETRSGKVQGYTATSFNGTKYLAFEGIPYAKPPTAERRFEKPEPVEPWSGILNATISTECPQTDMLDQSVIYGIEDCLHINVYVPRETINPEEKLDVFVHIHGGAFQYGSGTDYSHPLFLMDRDIVFVTFNYRIGIFGFLSTEDDVVPGNNGLKDQVLAMQWIQENIASFGGNPDSVTLSGGSAGSISVHLHYFSDLSKGLFHRGWAESGVALLAASLVEGNLEKAQKLGDALDCPTNSTQNMIDCLKEVPYEDILGKMTLFYVYNFLPIVPFGPVVEKGGSKPFLSEHPYLLLSQGKVYDAPLLISNDLHEATVILNAFTDLDVLNKDWDKLSPFILDFNYTLDPSLWQNTSEKIRRYYFDDKSINSDTYMTLIDLFNDRHCFVDTAKTLRMHTSVMKSAVYYYIFSYFGENPNKLVPHGAEVEYIYGFGVTYPYTNDDLIMRDRFLNMITSFAKTNVPVFEGVDWKPTKSDQIVYVNITGVGEGEVKLESREELAPESFWHSLNFAENENLFD